MSQNTPDLTNVHNFEEHAILTNVVNNQIIKITNSQTSGKTSDNIKPPFVLDTVFTKDEAVWLARLKNTWNLWKKGRPTDELLHSCFEQAFNPFHFTLKVTVNCHDHNDCKQKSLPYHSMEQLRLWKTARCDAAANLLDSNLKIASFDIACRQKNYLFLKLTVDTFDILSENAATIQVIDDMLSHHQYREAHQGIMALNLQGMFTIEKLLVPLVLQDKLSSVDAYLSSCPPQAAPLIEYLDNLLDRRSSIRNSLETFLLETGIPDVKWDKLHHKPLGKLLARLCNSHKLPIEFCKNLCRYRTIGGLRFLVHQKYSQNSLSDSAWADLVKDNLERCPDMKYELISLIDDYDPKEAVKWAKYYNFSLDEYPSGAKYLLTAEHPALDTAEENWNVEPSTSKDYYKLSLPLSNVVFVDNHQQFYNFLDIIKNYEFVGVDSEWKPSFGATQNYVALIQVATTENVFLLDTLTLNSPEDEPLWTLLWIHVFENVNIIKIGFGLQNDLREIKNSLPGLSSIKVKGLGLLELSNLWRSLKEYGVSLPYNSDNIGESLSSLVENCFGTTLDKHEQCSNWENRPLRESQLEYAALDSYVLVEIFLVFKRLSLQNKINFDQLCYTVMIENKPAKGTKLKKNLSEDEKQAKPVILPENAKFFVENCYGFLIALLRKNGIDTLPLPTKSTWSEIVNMALDENRFVIISNSKGHNINLLSKDHYLEIGKIASNHFEVVLQHFNIDSKLVKPFSRCQCCNSKGIKAIAGDILKLHFDHHVNSRRITDVDRLSNASKPSTIVNHEFDPDAFLTDEDDDECYYVPPNQSTKECEKPIKNYIELDKLSNAPLDCEGLSDSVLLAVSEFYICNDCGKCFWEN